MATATESSEPVVEYDDFIDDRLDRTSFHLKTLDCVTGLIWLGLFVFGSLFALVLIDHWIVGLGFWARAISLVTIFGVVTYLAVKRVIMPLVRSINPEYAALEVEKSHPEFKNGLINFLFFRDRRDKLNEDVYHGIREQAAAELGTVPIDSAVDRTPIIKLGYYFIALAAIWVGYILLSPKNPLQTVQRIAMPWRDISRPSQVDILEVMPGSVEIFRGQTVEVKAKIEGLKTDQAAEIQFATLDGQLVDQHIPLIGETGSVYTATLTTSGAGIQQNLEYRIRAGDALSQLYEVHVTEAPHIVVDRLEFDYPAYVGLADEMVQGEGDIRAIEGTRVTVIAKANQPIKRGHIEFVPTAESNSSTPKIAPLKFDTDATYGTVKFSLRMNDAGDAALYRAYRLHFTNENGQTSVDAIEHTIEVIPDLRPVVQILSPDKRTIELPENSWTKIEVRAVDPDFQLSRVQLAARTRGRPLLQEKMLSTSRSSEWHTGQFTATYKFLPRDHSLKVGDVVEYLAMAEDNKHAVGENELAPNRTISAKQYIRIVKADPMADKPPKDEQQQDDPNQPPRDQQPQNGSEGEKGNESQSSDRSEGESGEKADEQQNGEQEKGNEGSEASEKQEQEEGGEGDEDRGEGLQQESDSGGDSEQQSEGGSPGESSESNSEQTTGNNTGDQSRDSQGEQGNESNDPRSEQGGDPSADPSKSEGGEQQNGSEDNSGRGASEDEPLPSSGERDGEVVERIRDHMKEKGDLEEYVKKKQEEKQSGERSDSETSSDGEQGESGERPSDENSEQQETGKGSQGDKGNQNKESDGVNSEQTDSQGGNQDDPDGEKGNESPSGKSGDESQGSEGKQSGESGSQQVSKDDRENNKTGKSGESGTDSQTGEGKESNKSSDSQGETSDEDPSKGESPNGETQESAPATGDSPDDQNSGSEQQPSGDQQDSQNSDKKQNENGSQSVSPQQNQTGDNSSGDQPQQSPDSQSGETETEGKPSESSKNSPANKGGKPTGSPSAGDQQGGDGNQDGEIAGDDANLEYAREATDLVLEYLKDQEQKPDQELLDKLGWKQNDVDKFLRRWDSLKEKAKGPEPAAQENKSKLDDLLKGMGLEAPDPKLRRAADRNDKQRDNRNTGRGRKVPADLLDPFRAFQRSLQQTK